MRKRKKSILPKLHPTRMENRTISVESSFGLAEVLKETYTKTSYVTPGWPIKPPLPKHAYALFSATAVDPVSTIETYDWDGFNMIWTLAGTQIANVKQMLGPISHPDGNWDNDRAAHAARKAMAKLSNQSANLGEFFGEVHKTRQTFVDTVKRVTLAFLSLRKLDVRGAYHALDLSISDATYQSLDRKSKTQRARANPFLFAGNAWLSMHYGWDPFIDDMVGSATHLYDKLNGADFKTRIVAWPQPLEGGESKGTISGMIRSSTVYTTTSRYRCVLEVQLVNSAMSSLESLGLANLPRTAWNLLPYSFVVDKFINVDRFLGQLTAGLGYDFLSGTLSMYHRYRGIRQFFGQNSSNNLRKQTGTGRRVESETTKERRLLYTWPAQSLSDQEGSVLARYTKGQEQKLTHVASAAALLLQIASNVFLVKGINVTKSKNDLNRVAATMGRASYLSALEMGWRSKL